MAAGTWAGCVREAAERLGRTITTVILQPWSRGPLVSLRPFQRLHKVKTIFMVLRSYLPFSLLLSREYTVEFSRSSVKCDMATEQMQKQT